MMPSIKSLHHWAYRCRDAEETRHFYEDVLGLPLAHVVSADIVPSTGEYSPYVHIFFEMKDGSYVAFFDLGDNEITSAIPTRRAGSTTSRSRSRTRRRWKPPRRVWRRKGSTCSA